MTMDLDRKKPSVAEMSEFFEGGGAWGFVAGIGGAVLGWVSALVRNSTQISDLGRRMETVEKKVDRLVRDEADTDKEAAAALARINTTLSNVAEILNKMDARMNNIEERMSRQEQRK